MNNVPLEHAKLLWKDGGPLVVTDIRQKETEEQEKLPRSYGASNAEWIDAKSDEARLLILFEWFVGETMDGRLTPEEAHKGLLIIPEYRELFHDDLLKPYGYSNNG